VDQERVVAAAKASSNIHDFVTSLPHCYDTRVGDKGSRLSGGQKATYCDCPCLESQPKYLVAGGGHFGLAFPSLRSWLNKARAGRTTVVIAHRLSTIQDADLIMFVKDGQILEQGQHYQLVALGGV